MPKRIELREYIRHGPLRVGVSGHHFLVYIGGVESGAGEQPLGYLDIRPVRDPRDPLSFLGLILSLLKEAYSSFEPLTANSIYSIDTAKGRVEMLYQPGLPETAEVALKEMKYYFSHCRDITPVAECERPPQAGR